MPQPGVPIQLTGQNSVRIIIDGARTETKHDLVK